MFTEYFDVDKLHFKSSITLHVAHGYHIYHTRQCRLKAFLFFWHFFSGFNFWKFPIRTQITVIIWAAVTYSVSFTSQYWNLNLHPQYWVLDQRLTFQAPQQPVSPVQHLIKTSRVRWPGMGVEKEETSSKGMETDDWLCGLCWFLSHQPL